MIHPFVGINKDYIIEFKLKSRHTKELLPVDEKENIRCRKMVVSNYAVYGLMEHTKQDQNGITLKQKVLIIMG